MKKIKLAGALIPALLVGQPVIATSVRSNIRAKKVVSQKKENKDNKTLEQKNSQDPFSLFGASSSASVAKKENTDDVLAFLEEEGLLKYNNQKSSIQTGNNIYIKDFAVGGCATYTSAGTCNSATAYDCNWNGNACVDDSSDTTAPAFENSTPSQNSITHQQVVINVDIDEAGTVYAVVVGDGDNAPTTTEIKNGQESGGGAAFSSGNITLNSGTFSGQITLTGLTANTAYDVYVVAQDDEGSPNVQASPTKIDITTDAPPVDSDSTLTAGDGVDESSMILLPSTSNTFIEKVNLFDFTITDTASGDALTTDISQIVINLTGTATDAVRGKVKWFLNGPDAINIEGTYDSGADTVTFSSLSISIASGSDETYTLSGYYKDPTGLTDNATFTFTISDSDITTDGTKSTLAGSQSVDNGGNAKVDITATKLIFKTLPSN